MRWNELSRSYLRYVLKFDFYFKSYVRDKFRGEFQDDDIIFV